MTETHHTLLSGWGWVKWVGLTLTLLFALWVVVPLISEGGTLGHDESAYALKARAWLAGTPDTGWAPHRGIAMSLYGYLVLWWGGTEPALRLVGALGLFMLVSGIWRLGVLMGGTRVAVLAAVGVAALPDLLRRSSEYLSDVPAAGLLIWCLVVLWKEFEGRELPTYRLLWLLPLAWGAFYFRYQSALSLLLIALTVAVLWWPKIRSRSRPVLAVLVLGFIGLIPHFVWSTLRFGYPMAVLDVSSKVAGRAHLGEGLIDYSILLRSPRVNLAFVVLWLIALAMVIQGWSNRPLRSRLLFLLLPAGLQVAMLGLISHGELRFIIFPMCLATLAGFLAVDHWMQTRRRGLQVAVIIAASALLVVALITSTDMTRQLVNERMRSHAILQLAGETIESGAAGATCGVMTSYRPQITYYSGCHSELIATGDPTEALSSLPGEARFMMILEGGSAQPEEVVEALVELAGPGVSLAVADGRASVYRFR